MRKLPVLALLLSLISTSLFAQEAGKNRTGARIGVNYSNNRIRQNGESQYADAKTGLSIGLFREIALDDRFTFQPELYFNALGSKSGGSTTRFGYLSIPTLFKVHGKHFGFLAGPQVSLLLTAKEEVQYVGTTNVKDDYKSVDISGITGIEYTFGKKNNFVAGVRYQFAMNNIYKAVSGVGVFNYAWQGSLGFRF